MRLHHQVATLASHLACHCPSFHRADLACASRYRRLPTSSRVFNRKAVQTSLKRAVALWGSLASKDCPNGVLIFCSESIAHAVHPPKPLQRFVYVCEKVFDTSVLQQAVEAAQGPVYGVVAIDGSEALLGKVQGLHSASRPVVTKVPGGHLNSSTKSRTRRGGSSAARFSRTRDNEELEFLREVAEKVSESLQDATGLILAGNGDMKRKLSQQLSETLRKRVLRIVDLPTSPDLAALQLAASSAQGVATSVGQHEVELALHQFFELSQLPEDSDGQRYCFGFDETMTALELGAVRELLVAADFEHLDAKSADWKQLAEASGAKLIRIHPLNADSVRFSKGFGIGACLRWAVNSEQLDVGVHDSEEVDADQGCVVECALPGSSPHEVADLGGYEVKSANHEASCHQGEIICELEAELSSVMDASAAQSLAIAVDVILGDDSTPLEDILPCVEDVLSEAPAELVKNFMAKIAAHIPLNIKQ